MRRLLAEAAMAMMRSDREKRVQYVLLGGDLWVACDTPPAGVESKVVSVYDAGHRRLLRMVRERDLTR